MPNSQHRCSLLKNSQVAPTAQLSFHFSFIFLGPSQQRGNDPAEKMGMQVNICEVLRWNITGKGCAATVPNLQNKFPLKNDNKLIGSIPWLNWIMVLVGFKRIKKAKNDLGLKAEFPAEAVTNPLNFSHSLNCCPWAGQAEIPHKGQKFPWILTWRSSQECRTHRKCPAGSAQLGGNGAFLFLYSIN